MSRKSIRILHTMLILTVIAAYVQPLITPFPAIALDGKSDGTEFRVYLPLVRKSATSTKPQTSGVRLTSGDLTYQGAFRLPEAFNWGARGMAYYPEGNGGRGTLLIIGFDLNRAEYGEISIPDPAVESNWEDLPIAALNAGMVDFGSAIVETVSEDTAYASGIEYVPGKGEQTGGKLYGAIDNWYGVSEETHSTIWFSEVNGSNPRGPYHVGPRQLPYHGNKAGDFLFKVPQWYADTYLGGRILVTGKTRGAFNGSQGPTLFAFAPWDTETPSGDLDAVPMLYYRIFYPDCAGPNVGDKASCDYPNFTMCDKWESGGFVESGLKRSIILLGIKGLGTNYYGEAPGPDSCDSSTGYHCDPYERQVIFYDVDELGRAAQGQADPWSVTPYEIWTPREFFIKDEQGRSCGQPGGLAVDSSGKRLFMIEKGFGGHQNENGAVVHVWQIK